MYKMFAKFICVLILIISVTATDIIQNNEPIENGSSLVLSNVIVEKIKCITGILNQVEKEFELEDMLTNFEPKMLKSFNNFLLCLKHTGNWQTQSCMGKEMLSIGFTINAFMNQLNASKPEASKQLRQRLYTQCTDQ